MPSCNSDLFDGHSEWANIAHVTVTVDSRCSMLCLFRFVYVVFCVRHVENIALTAR